MSLLDGSSGLLLTQGLLLIGSAFCSSSETALFSLTRHERARFKKSASRLENIAASLLENRRALLSTLLIFNMTCNILIFVISTLLLSRLQARVGQSGVAFLSLVPVILVTYLSEILPKTIGSTQRLRLAPYVALPWQTLVRLTWPLGQLLEHLVITPAHRLLGQRPQAPFSTSEVRELLAMSESQGVIDVSENELLQQVVRLAELKVRDVMIPRVDILAFNLKDPPEKLQSLIRRSGLMKIPVYENQIDQILGILYAKSALLDPPASRGDIRKLIHPVAFVPEFISLERLLGQFRSSQTQMAFVVDEHGGLAGLVSLEDVVERMIGEIYGSDERPVSAVERLSADEYLVAGSLSVAEWSEAFGARVDLGRSTTVAGLLASQLQRLPKVGDIVTLGHLQLQVDSMKGRRVDRVRLRILEESATPEVRS